MNAETRNCQNCKQSFTLELEDFNFYEKIKVPPPTFCPDCRRQRRFAWRNNMSLYYQKCDLCGKLVVSIYALDSGLTIYCNKCWWSDRWDPKSYGQDYDFSKPFFSQFRELLQKVPHMSVVNDDNIASLNCEYTQDWWFSKNCYMCFSGWHVENVMYSFFMLAGRDMMDCINIRSKNEWLYECMIMSGCYQVKYSQFCLNCIDSQFLYDCYDCTECFMCTGLRNKKYHFKNQEYSKEEYKKILADYQLNTFSGIERARREYESVILKYPRRYTEIFHSVNCSGEIVSDSKDCKYCFVVKNAQNCNYCEFTGSSDALTYDCYDLTTCGSLSQSYEGVVLDHSQLNLFGVFAVKSQDIRYSQHCHNCRHVFGCVGLRDASYCILNKQYTKEEYEKRVTEIVEHMTEMPYIDKAGRIYKYGEFFPMELSPFGYNETCATEISPLTKDEAIAQGYNWRDNIQRTTGQETLFPEKIPESINFVVDTILDEVLKCMECERNYKIVPNELNFYRKMKIPIPRKCFYCRHKARVRWMNPFKLWRRVCMCEKESHGHEGKCPTEFETSYAPERPETIYCEKCYQQEVY